jgi:lipopolysaccharide export system protein LptC
MRVGLLYFAVLVFCATLSGWFLFTLESSLRENDPTSVALPTLYIDDFQVTSMNDQGIRHYTLTAPHLTQLPGQQGTALEKPDIDVFRDDGQIREWLIRADTGWIASDNQLVRLEEAVAMTRPPSSGKKPVMITTHDLFVYPYKDYAETAEPARMVTPHGVVDSVGFKALLREEQIVLLSDVRGNYEPPDKH